ncbi:MAG: cytochrome c [Longimicrobiales bacterium]
MAQAWLGAVLALVILNAACAPAPEGPDPAVLAVVAARSPAEFQEGKGLYAAYCATCHGENGGGSVVGPPLVHRIYRPSHHADAAFLFAVKNGVRAHHWRFGDMAPVPGLDVAANGLIVAYVRWLQVESGIE